LIIDEFLTEEQAWKIFNHKQGTSPSSYALDFLNDKTEPKNPYFPITADEKEFVWDTDICRDLRRAEERRDGPTFGGCIHRFNYEMIKLKASPIMKGNIERIVGLKERVWSRITAQAYERTVGPKVQMLKQYEKFSNNVYGELNSSLLNGICESRSLLV
jgi:[histone H3]-lysine79 N-trimethyltransferase